MTIGNKKYSSIIIAGAENEVLAVIDDEHIIEQNGITVKLESATDGGLT